jgi:hypothetical protein
MVRLASASVFVVALCAAAAPVSAYKYHTPTSDAALSYNMFKWCYNDHEQEFIELAWISTHSNSANLPHIGRVPPG